MRSFVLLDVRVINYKNTLILYVTVFRNRPILRCTSDIFKEEISLHGKKLTIWSTSFIKGRRRFTLRCHTYTRLSTQGDPHHSRTVHVTSTSLARLKVGFYSLSRTVLFPDVLAPIRTRVDFPMVNREICGLNCFGVESSVVFVFASSWNDELPRVFST